MSFGVFRLLLALFVTIAHLSPVISINIGAYSVSAFFIISGYLMTYILNTTYGFTYVGLRKYYINRFLRIYPLYFLVLIMTLIFLSFTNAEEVAFGLNNALKIPQTFVSWLHNITIIGIGPYFNSNLEPSRLIPPAWALHNELIFYIVIPFTARNFKITLAWFCISIGLVSFLIITSADWPSRYYTLQASSLPFSLGALLYYLKDNVKIKKLIQSKNLLIFSLILFLVTCFIPRIFMHNLFPKAMGYTFYINMMFSFMVVAGLSE